MMNRKDDVEKVLSQMIQGINFDVDAQVRSPQRLAGPFVLMVHLINNKPGT